MAGLPLLEEYYIPLRAQFVLSKYRRRRDRYAAICQRKGLVYSVADTVDKVIERLKKRKYSPVRRKIGEIHTFAFIPRISWHENLYNDLQTLGPVSEFDYAKLGYKWEEFSPGNHNGLQRRREMNAKIFSAVKSANQIRPIDWLFCYASGKEISAKVIQKIQGDLGIPTVNMCFDDKQSWEGQWMGDHRAGQIDIAAHFDLSWTSSRVATGWYLAEGGCPLFMPEGCNAKSFVPVAFQQDIPVSFIGEKYGFRSSVVRFLREKGIKVEVFGRGWKNGRISDEKAAEIQCRSVINLGMGGIGMSESLTNVKGRDFEVPCNGGMYLTSFNPDLALHFDVGKEIVCYRSRDELLELVRYYLEHSEEARAIGKAGRERCLREHRWIHRYLRICQVLGILEDDLLPGKLVD